MCISRQAITANFISERTMLKDRIYFSKVNYTFPSVTKNLGGVISLIFNIIPSAFPITLALVGMQVNASDADWCKATLISRGYLTVCSPHQHTGFTPNNVFNKHPRFVLCCLQTNKTYKGDNVWNSTDGNNTLINSVVPFPHPLT